MSLADDLPALAGQLARLDPTRPRQATLRRAVSTAYYGLFHLLTAEATGLFVGSPDLAGPLGRVLDHGEMKRVSQQLASSRLPRVVAAQAGAVFTGMAGSKLKQVAQTFADLQEARHEADYNPVRRFTRSDALRLVGQAEQAFAAWADIRRADEAKLYLGCLLLWDRWDKPPR